MLDEYEESTTMDLTTPTIVNTSTTFGASRPKGTTTTFSTAMMEKLTKQCIVSSAEEIMSAREAEIKEQK